MSIYADALEHEGQETWALEPDPNEIYWALKDAKDLISALKEKESRFFTALEQRNLKRMWRVMYCQYYGQDPDSVGNFDTQMISVTGEDGELLTFRLNEVRPLVSRQIQMAVGERPAFQCIATNTDHASRAQIGICDSIVTYVYGQGHLEGKEREVVESDSCFGSGFGWARWDQDGGSEVSWTDQVQIPNQPPEVTAPVQRSGKSGAPTVTTKLPWEVVQEHATRDHMWRMVRERTSKWELIAKFPELGNLLRAIKELDEYTTERFLGLGHDDDDTDDVIVKHFYHVRCAAAPNGRYVGFVGDLMLWDLPLPVADGMPIKEMCSEPFMGSSFGYASGWDLVAPNMMIDQLLSDTASNLATFGRQCIGMFEGTDFDIDALANGLRAFSVPIGAEMPQAINFAAMPEPVKWVLEFCLRRMEGISGVNSVARGDPQSNITSGSMAALFHEIAIEFQAPRQTAFDGYREGMANLLLDLVRLNAKPVFVAELAGDDERPYQQQFEKSEIAGVKRVIVKTANPMMRTIAGRMEIFNAVKGIPNPTDRRAAINLLLNGDAKDFTNEDQSETLAIKWENEQLAKGIPVPSLFLDDHKQHFAKHKAELNARREALMQDPVALKTLLDHIVGHQVAYDNTAPVISEWNNMPPAPMYRMGAPGPQPANDNMAPEGAMGGDGGGAGKAATAVAGVKPQGDPAAASGTDQPSQPEPAQAPGGPAQNQGEAA